MSGVAVLTTERLGLSEFDAGDAPFVLELLTEPAFRRYIGDKGVADLDGARQFLEEGPIASYRQHGFGIWHVTRREDGASLGMCGLVQRDGFDAPDLGFAFLERHWGRGYAFEAAAAVMNHARDGLALGRVLAMADDGNAASLRLLTKLDFSRAGTAHLPGESQDVQLFAAVP